MNAARALGSCLTRFGHTVRAICAGLVLVVTCSPVAAENLHEVFELAVRSDPEFLAAGADNRAAQEALPQARARLRPSVGLSLDAAWNENRIRADHRSHGATLNIEHPIYNPERWAVLAQADSRIAAADARYSAASQQLMVRVAQRYFAVLEAEDALRFAHATLEAFEQQLEQSRQRFEVGIIAITDVEEAKAGFDLARAQLIAAENALDIAHEDLRETSGEYRMELAPLGEMPLVTPEPADIDRWTEIALGRNLGVLASRHAAETARREMDRARAGHLPVIDAVGSYGRYDSVSRAGETNSARIGLRLNVPLYSGGLVRSRTRQSQHLYQKALDNLERARRQAQRDTRDAYLSINSEISRVTALEQAVRSSETAADAIAAGFQLGTRTSVDVLDAKRDLFRARHELARARYGYILNLLQLKRAAGVLAQADLRMVSDWLE